MSDQQSKEGACPEVKRSSSKCEPTRPATAADGLRDLIACPICLERMCRPKMLPCQHTFCLECLQSMSPGNSKAGEKSICCPQCRKEHTPPPEGVAALPNNIYLQSLLDLLETQENACARCKTICEVRTCEHCVSVLCGVCLESHLDDLRTTLGEISAQVQSTNNKIDNKLRLFKEECEVMNSQIEEESLRRVQEIKLAEADLVRHLREAVVSEEVIANDARDRLNQISKSLKKAMDVEFDVPGHSTTKIETFLSLRQEASDLLSEMADLDHKQLVFNPRDFQLHVHQDVAKGEELDVTGPKEPATVSEGESTSDDHSTASNLILDEHSRLYRSRSFGCRGRLGAGMLQRPSGLAVSPPGASVQEAFVVSMDSHRIFVFDLHTGKVVRSFGQRGQRNGEFLCPFGIALCPLEQKILVTDKWKHCIHAFDMEGRFLRQIGSKGRSPGHFRSPEAICVDQQGCIYICDTCNSRIQVLDKDGNFLSEIGVRSQVEAGLVRQRSMFHEPTGIAVSPDGQRVYVCDFGQHRIHVFSPSGQHLSTFGQKGNLRGQFVHPECVAVDQKGFVFVGDCGNGRVQICRPDGRFVRGFGTRGSGGGQFGWISSIAVTNKFDVVISDFKNHCVQVF